MDQHRGLRESLLGMAWREILATTPDNVRNLPAAARAIDAGGSIEDVVTAMRAASYETAFRLLYFLSSVHTPDDEDHARRGWALVAYDLVNDAAEEGKPLALEGVYEDLMEADPSGRAGEDLWN
jgi:hypothetical protein